MSLPERIAVALVGLLLLVAVVEGARSALPGAAPDVRDTPESGAFVPPPVGANPHALSFAAGARQRAGIDPLRPPGLPAGARIDEASGLLTGVDLQPAADELALDWARLATADGVASARHLSDAIRALEGRTVVMAGFLMPLYEVDRIREFLLVGSHYACCFGKPPGLGGMVMVRLAPDQAPLTPLVEPLRVRGTLRIREQRQGERPTDPLLLLFEIEAAGARRLGY